MTWYSKDIKKELDYNKPIFAHKDGCTLILLPQIKKESYTVVGYNWFRLNNDSIDPADIAMKYGEYNSCAFFLTVIQAIKAYNNWSIYNGTISINKD